MSSAPLFLSSLASSIAAGVFLVVGLTVQRKEVEADAKQAMSLFSIWWAGLAVYALNEALLNLAAAFDLSFGIILFLRLAQFMAFSIGLWGLAYYVSYVLTGNRGFMAPLAVVYGLYYAVLLFAIVLGRPTAVAIGAWQVDLAYEDPTLPTSAMAALFTLPPLVAAGTYAALYFSAASRAHRARVAMVSLGTIGWLGSLMVVDGAPLESWTALPMIFGLASAALVMLAYRPTRWLARSLHVE